MKKPPLERYSAGTGGKNQHIIFYHDGEKKTIPRVFIRKRKGKFIL
jgi:hypothetical protein